MNTKYKQIARNCKNLIKIKTKYKNRIITIRIKLYYKLNN